MSKYQEPNFPAIFTQGQDGLRQFDKDLVSVLANWADSLAAILDGGISPDDNMDISRVSVTSDATPGTEFSVAHGLGKIPLGYIVTGQNLPGSLYDGATANTKEYLYLKANAASVTFRLMVF